MNNPNEDALIKENNKLLEQMREQSDEIRLLKEKVIELEKALSKERKDHFESMADGDL